MLKFKPGNAIGVRVNAQYPGWENYAKSGQLVVRISNSGTSNLENLPPNNFADHLHDAQFPRPYRLSSPTSQPLTRVSLKFAAP